MSFPSHSHNGDPILYGGTNVLWKTFPVSGPRRVSFVCNSNKNPDFSRRQKGSSRGRIKQFQDEENSENIEEANLSSSGNGPLLSLVSNPRYQATATPGRREKEIVELFRKVQVQLRERAAIKEEKKMEAAQQGQAERGTVDSLLKLLRKHSVDQKKKSGGEEDFNLDQPERRSNPFEDEQNSNIFGPNDITSEGVREPDPVPFTRPASNFRRKSPVPRVKFQSVFSAEEDVSLTSSLKKSQEKKRKTGNDEPLLAPDPESVSVDGPDEVYLGDPTDGTSEEPSKSSTIEENPDLGSLKLPELKGLAKSRGIKGVLVLLLLSPNFSVRLPDHATPERLIAPTVQLMGRQGYLVSDGKCLPCLGMSGRMSFPSHSHNGDPILYGGTNVLWKTFPVSGPRRVSFVCNSNKNPDFSRRQKGSSRGRIKQFQDEENSENIEEANLSSSGNGPLLSLVSNPRYQATATPGRREKEIVELFRKVQVQLRERAAIKEEKKMEAAQQGQAERGTVDSLLKLLRKHSVDQKKKSGGEEDFNLDQPERRSNPFEDEQNSNIFGPNDITSEGVREPDPVPFTRPASNFRRKSPVPRVKFQSVFSAEEDVSLTSSLKKSQEKKRKTGNDEPLLAPDPESVSVDGPDEVYLGDPTDGTSEEPSKSSTIEENPDLGSLKLPELKGLAKSRGIKGYSKMKKGELLEVLGS
ncbi:putative SAP-like protein BP-73 [Cocos nucifera]|uniref:Putative SAP-like protein BP-73 n=1 Tax=Cocos nucifera TaxID=13894 RepID=A0A8K0N8U9_COCNU|nr:putative SAP-like protein BP-73 [Cocos nucifera]